MLLWIQLVNGTVMLLVDCLYMVTMLGNSPTMLQHCGRAGATQSVDMWHAAEVV